MNTNYVLANNIDADYELWKRGYRVNSANYSLKQFIEEINNANHFDSVDETFDNIFNMLLYNHKDWFVDEIEEAQKYREENEPELRKYFNKYFNGKSWAEIKNSEELYNRWDFYSDWHKDVYGYRPHDIVCG